MTESPATSLAPSRRAWGRRVALWTTLLGAAVVAVSSTFTWVDGHVTTVVTGRITGAATGQEAHRVLIPLALAAAASGIASAVSRTTVRRFAGVVTAAIGGCISWLAGATLAEPTRRLMAAFTARHGGLEVTSGSAQATGWPWVVMIAGAAVLAAGLMAVGGVRWPATQRRYEQEDREPRPGESDLWTQLSHGHDPT